MHLESHSQQPRDDGKTVLEWAKRNPTKFHVSHQTLQAVTSTSVEGHSGRFSGHSSVKTFTQDPSYYHEYTRGGVSE
jgi:hypothetical protein